MIQEMPHGVGHSADADLDGGPVRHLLCNQFADFHFPLPDFYLRHFRDGVAAFHDVIHVAHVDDVFHAVDKGALVVHLHDHLFHQIPHESVMVNPRGAVAHVSFGVGRRNLAQEIIPVGHAVAGLVRIGKMKGEVFRILLPGEHALQGPVKNGDVIDMTFEFPLQEVKGIH